MLNLYQIRKELHKIPEIGLQEFKTKKIILNILKQFDNIKIYEFDIPGILVEFSNSNGEYKLFRSDMDALPVFEETDCDFQSLHPGRMHSCGHDIHMTILIGLIEKVIYEKMEQNLLFLFQPAEEGLGGAQKILESNIWDKFEISEAYALHVNGSLPVGTVSTKPGIFFADTEEFHVIFKGKSAHVAHPEKGHNALAAGVEFYQIFHKALKGTSFEDSVICEFGKMTAGTVVNAIAANCTFEGTMRSYNPNDKKKIKTLLKQSTEEASNKHKVKPKINYLASFIAVNNNAILYEKLKRRISDLNIEFIPAERVLTGEDFGFFSKKYGGLLFWLGANQGEIHDLHSTKFLPDEKAIDIGIKIFMSLI